MLMPTKIIQPVDSLFSISAYILKVLKNSPMNTDELLENLNKIYLKNISLEQLILSLNFLYVVDKIGLNNEIITIKIK